jgi:hypothetical protein
MKKYLLILSFLVSILCDKASGQTADSTLNQLLSINEADFINKPLDSIIAILPTGYTRIKIYGIRNTARMLSVRYPNKVWIELHVRQFNYMNPVDANNIWDITLMRKENLYKRSIYKGKNCYAGCPDYYIPPIPVQ